MFKTGAGKGQYKEKDPEKIYVIVHKAEIENKRIIYVIDGTLRTTQLGQSPQFHNPTAARKKMRDWGLSQEEYVVQSVRFGEAVMAMRSNAAKKNGDLPAGGAA